MLQKRNEKKTESSNCMKCLKAKAVFAKKSESQKVRIPAGCAACGGPYPMCKTSCPMFDD